MRDAEAIRKARRLEYEQFARSEFTPVNDSVGDPFSALSCDHAEKDCVAALKMEEQSLLGQSVFVKGVCLL